MVCCRAGLRSDKLSGYTDFFTSHEPLQTNETRMQYTMLAVGVFYHPINKFICLPSPNSKIL